MFKTNPTHTVFNEDEVASESGAVVLFNTGKQDYKTQRFIGAVLLSLSIGLISLQANWVYNASAEDAPITSPVTSEESPSPSPSAPVTSPEVTPSPSSNPSNNGGSNGGNGGNNNSSNGGGSVGAPSCNTEAPKNAPVIISALSTGKNEITLNWSKVEGNVSEYVVAYGLVKGKPMYGAQFGNVTSTTVKGLAGGVTYFFKVRAGNGCMPGAYSGEIAVKVGGKFINTPAQGFKPGVLGKSIKKNISVSPAPFASSFVTIKTEAQTGIPDTGLIGKIFNFIGGFFK